MYPIQHVFAEKIKEYSSQSGVPVSLFDHSNRWVQDWFESAYTSIPGEDGRPVVLRLMLKSSRHDNPQDRKVFTEMRSDTVGALQTTFLPGVPLPKQKLLAGLEAMGNVETIPPYSTKDKSYPNGRPIMGVVNDDFPTWFQLLGEQSDTAPVFLDLTWLRVGHIDEVVQFLPCEKSKDNPFGWVMAVVDPELGVQLVNNYPEAPSMSRPDNEQWLGTPKRVMDVFLEKDLVSFNKQVAAKVTAMIEDFLEQTGLPKNIILRVPTVFHALPPGKELRPFTRFNEQPARSLRRSISFEDDRASRLFSPAEVLRVADDSDSRLERRGNRIYATSLYANPINGILLNHNRYLAPQPWGPPGSDGKDIIAKAVADTFAQVGVTVEYMDDWWSHHVLIGEVHCGTNALRDASQKWWLPLEQR